MDKYAFTHNRIRKLAKLLRQQKLLKQAGYMPYALGGGLGAAAGAGLGALIGGKKHRGLGAGIGTGAGAGLGLLGAYLSQNAFGGSAVPATPPTTPEAPAGKPAPQAASQAASTVPPPLETTPPGAPSSPNPNVPHIDPNATVEIPPNAPVEPLDLENLPPASMTAVDSGTPQSKPYDPKDPSTWSNPWDKEVRVVPESAAEKQHREAIESRSPYKNMQGRSPDLVAEYRYDMLPENFRGDMEGLRDEVKELESAVVNATPGSREERQLSNELRRKERKLTEMEDRWNHYWNTIQSYKSSGLPSFVQGLPHTVPRAVAETTFSDWGDGRSRPAAFGGVLPAITNSRAFNNLQQGIQALPFNDMTPEQISQMFASYVPPK